MKKFTMMHVYILLSTIFVITSPIHSSENNIIKSTSSSFNTAEIELNQSISKCIQTGILTGDVRISLKKIRDHDQTISVTLMNKCISIYKIHKLEKTFCKSNKYAGLAMSLLEELVKFPSFYYELNYDEFTKQEIVWFIHDVRHYDVSSFRNVQNPGVNGKGDVWLKRIFEKYGVKVNTFVD